VLENSKYPHGAQRIYRRRAAGNCSVLEGGGRIFTELENSKYP
jgi:hypothetical protein